jgi:CubicO group peptidase (beta-lactamase class C family)
MLSRICGALLISAVTVGPALAAAGVAIEAGTMPQREAKRTVLYLRLYARANNYPGVVFMSRKGEPLVRRVFGVADAETNVSNTMTTRFHLGSLSQIFAGTAVALLEQEGKLTTPVPSGAHAATLERIVETASGQRYADFVQQRIISALGLTHTGFGGGAGRIAIGTEPVGLHGVRNVRGAPDANSIATTGKDLCDFARAVWNGGFLSSASLAKVRAGGYGWAARERKVGHTAMGGYGRAPGFGTSLDYFPDSQTCIALLTNTSSHVAQVAAPDIATISLGSPVARLPMGYETPAYGSLAKFSGAYQMPANFVHPNATVTLSDRGTYLEAAWPNGTISVIYPASDDYFVDRNAWASVRFTRGPGGAVTGLEYNLVDRYTARRVQ